MTRPDIPAESVEYDLVIGGESVPAESGDRFDVEYPYTRDVWATVPEGGAADVEQAVSAAQACYESEEWQSLTATERGQLLFDLADVIEDHTEELGRLESQSNGKLYSAMRGQAEGLPGFYRFYGGLADKVTGDTIPVDDDAMFNFTLQEPYGVVGAITPWNSPLMLATYKIAPAIAAGNTVVHKPSEITPVTAIRLAQLTKEAGWPDGAYNVVTGFGEAGAAITEHDQVRKVAFTGGLPTGKLVGKAAGEGIKPVTLELGGKSPNIVFPDADLDNAVTGAIKGIFAATGQTCIAGSRLFLHEDIEDEFLDRLVERAETLTLGDPFDPETEMAPVAFEGQFEKVDRMVKAAKDEGATVLTGGEPREDLPGGLFYPPTILTDVDNDDTIACEEVFGPVLSVLTFADEDEVVELANDTEFGLASAVWTNDLQRSIRMVQAIEAGVVWVNTYRESSFLMPFQGFKQSGVGVEKGAEAIEEYLQTKSVWIETEGEVSDPFTLM